MGFLFRKQRERLRQLLDALVRSSVWGCTTEGISCIQGYLLVVSILLPPFFPTCFGSFLSRMAPRSRTSRRMPAFLSILALMLLTLLDTSAAVTEKKSPSRTFRVRARNSDNRSPLPQTAGMRTVRRFRGNPSNLGESTRRVNYAPVRPVGRNEDNKPRASESVHVVSLQSMNPQGKSQPVYRAAVTKLKIPEDDYIMEPKEVGVRVLSSQSMLVTWVDPQYEKSPKVDSNRHYTIRYREKGESARWDYKQINTRRALIDKLNPDAMYEFSVRISQGDQESQWSSSVFQRTPESAPTTAPENLYVELLRGKPTSVRVMWDELTDSAGKIKEYIVSYAPAMKPFGGKSLPYSGTSTSAIVDGLQPGERYIFKIRAANRRGQGPQSKAFTVTIPVGTAAKDLYHQSHREAFSKEERNTDNVISSESVEEDIQHPFPKTNFREHEVNTHSMEVTDDMETTTLIPKISTPSPRRQFRPMLNNRFNSNAGRRPLRTNSQNVGRRIIEHKPAPPPTVAVDDNETKDLQIEESDNHDTIEDKHSSKNDEEIANENRERDSSNVQFVDTQGKSSVNVDSRHDLEKIRSTSSISNPARKEPTSVNTRKNHLAKVSTHQKPVLTQISVDEVERDQSKIDRNSKSTSVGQKHSSLVPSPKVDTRQAHFSIPLNKETTLSIRDSVNSDLHAHKESRDSDTGLHDIKTKTFNGHRSSKMSDPKTRKQTMVRGIVKPVSSTTFSPTSTTTATTTTTTTTMTTTTATTAATTTTTETPLPSKINKQNVVVTHKKEASSSKPQQIPSYSGKSALSLLEYYRRRSSQVRANVGNKITSNGESKFQPVTTTQTTTSTTVVPTTLAPKAVKKTNQGNLLEVHARKKDPDLGSSDLSSRSSHVTSNQKKDMKKSEEKHSAHTSAIQVSKKGDKKISTSSKQNTGIHNVPVKKNNVAIISEPLQGIITSKEGQIPSVGSHSSEKTSNSQVHEDHPEERKNTHNMHRKQSTGLALYSKPTTESSFGSALLPSNRNVDSKKSFEKQGHDSSTSLSRDSLVQSHDTFDIEEDNHSQHQAKISTSDRESLSLSRSMPISESRPIYRTPGSIMSENEKKSSKVSSSGIDLPVKHVPAYSTKSDISTLDTRDVPSKQPSPEKEKFPARTRLSSYSNVRYLKNRNRNGNINNNKQSLETDFTKLEDEETLSAPPTLKENSHKPPAVSSSYMNSKRFALPKKTTTTVSPTTSRPQSTTRASPYRLLPSISRQLHYGRSSIHRTTTPPTTTPARTASPTYQSSLLRQRMLNSRLGSPLRRQFTRPLNRQGNSGTPNLASRVNTNGNTPSSNTGSLNGQRMIYGPEGTKWVVDLNRGVILNTEGRYLQDSQGKPLRVKLGGDGRTIVDLNGTPVVSPDGLPLFGHGRFSKPVASAQDRPVMSLGGRPLRGLEVARTTRPTTTRMTTTPTTTMTTTLPPTTTIITTPEPTTVEPTTEEPFIPTCAPGSFAQYDEEGNMIMGPDDKPDCYTEDSYSGQDLIVTTEAAERVTYFDLDQDYELIETTRRPIQTTTTRPPIIIEEPEIRSFDDNLVSEFDATGKKRFTAPYVSYISKDPNTPCSLTDALEHFQVDNLADLLPKEMKEELLPPKNISYNITVVAVEGCHSFVILDWAKPKQGDFITGYLVYSASYDDYLKNKWSTGTAGGTNFPIENLKPNTRYYFQIQARNPHGLGPMSPYVSFVTESDNPLLIVRPPGGEPIWIPYVFKHDSGYSGCHGKQYVKRTWYRKFVGVILCNSLRYKIYLSENLRDTFYTIGDSWGRGEDHCQFVDSYMEGKTDPFSEFQVMPPIKGYYRQYTQEPVMFGQIGYGTPHNYVGWYECGVPIPGKW
ncbi:fibronectin type III domain-containing protein 1 [Rhinoderma darwinii]|uniref:fibronectin type III domain-containing protein 1 n=1 Tax=Rhinoderma darwinii TaxID=43563 RepID=UPI003F66AFBA